MSEIKKPITALSSDIFDSVLTRTKSNCNGSYDECSFFLMAIVIVFAFL